MIKTRLEAYRRNKRTELIMDTIMNSLKSTFSKTENVIECDATKISLNEVKRLQDDDDTVSIDSEDDACRPQSTLLTTVVYILYFLLWATLYVIAIEIQFGTVYFILSLLVFIWLNTSSKPKKKGQLSAYSVFNPRCEAIEGTLDASQFEREIRYGIVNVH